MESIVLRESSEVNSKFYAKLEETNITKESTMENTSKTLLPMRTAPNNFRAWEGGGGIKAGASPQRLEPFGQVPFEEEKTMAKLLWKRHLSALGRRSRGLSAGNSAVLIWGASLD